jgi:hypothetical protein
MTIFNILKKIYKEIHDAISQFWWSDDDYHEKMHWAACGSYVYRKRREAWVFEIFTLSIQQCLQKTMLVIIGTVGLFMC